MFSYLDVTIKLMFGFAVLVLQINLLGKGNLAPSNAIDQLQNYVLGGLVGGMIYNADITFIQFFTVLLIWTLIVAVARFAVTHNAFCKRLVDGEPTDVVLNGQVLVENVTQLGLSAHELSFKLRTEGINDIRNVKKAVLEQNGQLTITKVGENPVRYPMIMDGQVDPDALDLANHDQKWLDNELAKRHVQINQVYMAILEDDVLQIYCYE